MTNVDSKLEVLCERIAHVIHSLETIDKKVTDQNHSVAKVKEWICTHEEQAQSRSRHICENETRLSALETTLQPVIALVRYPLAFGIGIAVLFFSTMVGLYSSVTSIL
jgi:hypothetical protein